MEQVTLGSTGRAVARVGLGAMPLSIDGRPDRETSKRVVHRAIRLGVTLIDTADVYCLGEGEIGHNERLIRESLDEAGTPTEVVVATKGGMDRVGERWVNNARPRHLRAAVERSLRALGVECIDLYQLHAPDPEVPFEESVGEISRFREEGKVAAVGLSNISLEQLDLARSIVPIASVQNRFNPWDRAAETDGLIARCDANDVTFLPYSPVGGRRRVVLLRESAPIGRIAARFGATPEQAVLAWILSRSPSLVPIPGSKRMESIESSVAAAAIQLDAPTLTELEEAFSTLPA
jgi:aryl-alcohol dehydrogenase-like predicted oxidoreductase